MKGAEVIQRDEMVVSRGQGKMQGSARYGCCRSHSSWTERDGLWDREVWSFLELVATAG